jgi:hypothetical protein
MERESLNMVVAGSILANDVDIVTQEMNDVLDSLLYAHLMADGEAQRLEAPQAWIKAYRRELISVGWTGFENSLDQFEPEDASNIIIDELIEQNLLNELPAARASEVSTLLDSIFAIPQTDAVSLLVQERAFKRAPKAQGHSSIALQVSILQKPTVLSSLFLTFKTTSTIELNPLHQVLAGCSVAGAVEAYFFKCEWSRAGYKHKRARVNHYLADKRDGKILHIPKGECPSHGDHT